MSVFFNGRLLITPTTASVVDDSALANRNLTVGNNLAIVGKSSGGAPNKALTFGSPSEATAVLRSGELLDAVLKAFDPSPQTGGPAYVTAVRVNPASQSSLALLDAGAAPVINLTSTDYGLYTKSIKVKIESGTTVGKKITTQLGNDYYTQDNVARNAFKVRYSGGAASAAMTIGGSTISLQAPSGTSVLTIDLSEAKTISDVVDRINGVTGFSASVLDGNGGKIAKDGLDYATNADVKTADYTAKADLQAVVDYFNGNPQDASPHTGSEELIIDRAGAVLIRFRDKK